MARENLHFVRVRELRRVTNFLDFEDRLQYVQPGEILYLSVVHDGKREQLRISLPPPDSISW